MRSRAKRVASTRRSGGRGSPIGAVSAWASRSANRVPATTSRATKRGLRGGGDEQQVIGAAQEGEQRPAGEAARQEAEREAQDDAGKPLLISCTSRSRPAWPPTKMKPI